MRSVPSGCGVALHLRSDKLKQARSHQTFDCVAQIFLVQLHPQCRLRMQSFFGCGQHGAGASLVFQLSVPQKAESLGRDVRSVKRINQA